jgi:hypothetical protein
MHIFGSSGESFPYRIGGGMSDEQKCCHECFMWFRGIANFFQPATKYTKKTQSGVNCLTRENKADLQHNLSRMTFVFC